MKEFYDQYQQDDESKNRQKMNESHYLYNKI